MKRGRDDQHKAVTRFDASERRWYNCVTVNRLGRLLQAVFGHLYPLTALAAGALVAGDLRAADCLTSAGQTACGFHCVASYGHVRCSQTPEGVCSTISDIVACWDPPPVLRRVDPKVAAPSCLTSHGQTACGYDCVSGYDRVLCAQTPYGACLADEGNVVCWDPPAAVIAARGDKTRKAACVARSGKVACGYHCAVGDGEVRCGDSPEGTCRRQAGALVCWDPPLETTGAVVDPASELSCIDAGGGRKCGYRCLATISRSACGGTRADYCQVKGEEIVCKSQ